jgi:hypothetical protein
MPEDESLTVRLELPETLCLPTPLGIVDGVYDPPSPLLRGDVIDWCSQHLRGEWSTRFVHGISPRIRDMLGIDDGDPVDLMLAGKMLATHHAVIEITDPAERTHFVLCWLSGSEETGRCA